MKHDLRWHTPAPFWDRSLGEDDACRDRFHEPALLRFSQDTFMEDYQAVLHRSPGQMADYVARRETWDDPDAGWEATNGDGDPLKLFQPIHHRFYLVAGSLVCRTAGLPDRAVNAATERISFVLRRIVPRTDSVDTCPMYDEYGWFGDRQQGRWRRIDVSETVSAREERLPLFSTAFSYEGGRRRIHAGLVPVGAREMYESGWIDAGDRPTQSDIDDDSGDLVIDPRLAEFDAAVIENLKSIEAFPEPPQPSDSDDFNRQARERMTFALLDLLEFLEKYREDVADAIKNESNANLQGFARTLYETLQAKAFGGHSLLSYLHNLYAHRTALDRGEVGGTAIANNIGSRADARSAAEQLLKKGTHPDDAELHEIVSDVLGDDREDDLGRIRQRWLTEIDSWNVALSDQAARRGALTFALELTDLLQRELPVTFERLIGGSTASDAVLSYLAGQTLGATNWRDLIAEAERRRGDVETGDVSAEIAVLKQPLSTSQVRASLQGLLSDSLFDLLAAAIASATPRDPADGEDREAIYVVRCVYERPRCAGFEPPTISRPSRPFALASFFDPDAPVRPVNIRLPGDTGIGGLRKFAKSVKVIMSNKLRQQMARVTQTDPIDVAEGNVGEEPTFDLGMACTMSIPIITICALILLMIVVQILNIVFWWLPYFKICLPVRGRS